jgi:hypothetical protein
MRETKQLVVHAMLAVTYDVTDTDPKDVAGIPDCLQNTITRQIGAGLLTDGTDALVESYSISAMSLLPLWFVHAQSEDGDSMDLFVRAKTRDDAEKHWKEYFIHMEGQYPAIDFIHEIPFSNTEGAISWNDILGEEA